jgi:hypothetical protein
VRFPLRESGKGAMWSGVPEITGTLLSVVLIQFLRNRSLQFRVTWGKLMGNTHETFENIIPDAEVNEKNIMSYDNIFKIKRYGFSLSR